MLKTAAIALLSIPVLLIGLLMSSSCVVVDVQQADGPRILVPVPLFAARAALAFAPSEARQVNVPEIAEYHALAISIIDELMDAPDGVLVEVRDRSEHVLVEKVGDLIEISVDGEDETVCVKVPLSAVADVLDSFDGGKLETRDVLAALSSISTRDLVHVKTKDEEVKVWIW